MDGVFFKLGLKKKMVNLQIPLAFVIGDIQGGDYICGRPPVSTQLVHWISRTCDATPRVYCQVWSDNCQCLVMQDVIDLVQCQKFDNLRTLYQAPHWLAFLTWTMVGIWEVFLRLPCQLKPCMLLRIGFFCILPKNFSIVFWSPVWELPLTTWSSNGICYPDKVGWLPMPTNFLACCALC